MEQGQEGEGMEQEQEGIGLEQGQEGSGMKQGQDRSGIEQGQEGGVGEHCQERGVSEETVADISVSDPPDQLAFGGDFDRHLSVVSGREREEGRRKRGERRGEGCESGYSGIHLKQLLVAWISHVSGPSLEWKQTHSSCTVVHSSNLIIGTFLASTCQNVWVKRKDFYSDTIPSRLPATSHSVDV